MQSSQHLLDMGHGTHAPHGRPMMRTQPPCSPCSQNWNPQPSQRLWKPCVHQSLAGCNHRQVACRNVNDFRQSFQSPEPGRSNNHGDGDGEQTRPRPGVVGYLEGRSYQVIGEELPPYVQQRLAVEGPPTLGAQFLETLIVVDQERERWPRIQRDAQGQWHFSPGFLLRITEVLPAEFVLASAPQQVVQVAVIAAYAAALVMAAQYALAANFNLGLALVVTWARDKLSLGRLALICVMAWFGNLWLYWVFFVGARIDDLLKRIAPPIRKVCWVFFILWITYVALSPLWAHPTPWFNFANGNDPFFRGYPLLRQ